MGNLYNELKQRGFLYQCTDEEAVRKHLDDGAVTFYIGFDPTADSLHVGSLIPIIGMMHMQRAGHRPIALVGGGTGLVGDPSGKTEMRKLLLSEQIGQNTKSIERVLRRFLNLEPPHGMVVNNHDWLAELKYIDFLRDVGRHFSVNKMLAAESYRARLETGLTFLEFNYMLLQSYDFFVLQQKHGCILQMGGQDQWGNIVAGIDLVRRMASAETYGVTFPLLTDSAGNKFGKSVKGAVWLSADKTPPFEFYQFWRNVEDADVLRLMKLYTFLPVEECERLGSLAPPLLNRAKEILAYEVTSLVHGPRAAEEAFKTATAHFPASDPECRIATTSPLAALSVCQDVSLPEVAVTVSDEGVRIVELVVAAGLAASNGEARRLIRGGGVRLDDAPVTDETLVLSAKHVATGPILKAGKKRLVRIVPA